MAKEMKRSCNKCGTVWYSTWTQDFSFSNKTLSCPKCNSKDYYEAVTETKKNKPEGQLEGFLGTIGAILLILYLISKGCTS